MGKKKKQGQKQAPSSQSAKTEETLTLQDQLNGDVLAKLKAAKKSLVDEEQAKEEERQARLAFERKQREKNMSFEELLEKYGDQGSKF
ncbi:YqkE family protein [Ureibacillus aquaedulcis]|uniref:YqkE family protein n=1 Tax=Ureibacillus aquaedulcis TaxID=3058421 RepID=A0ABT8GR96_9BACL|nr:YqkE family protein [Ureibacillus sp. BA0131]MDN4493928.1 YqkE family protein [Ureibacillus sp. BA0131]